MKQQQIACEHEAFPAELSWVDIMDLNIQVDYDAVISFEDDSDSPIKPEDESAEIQGESGPSGDSESPTSLIVKQETTSSAGFEITPSVEVVEETSQHVIDLTKQVDDLKKELQSKILDLHEERDRRIACQAEVKSQQEEIEKLQKMVVKEHHLRVQREHGRNVPENKDVAKVSCSSKVTADKSILQQLDYFKREAEKYASRNKGLIEVMVEEYRVRLKYEEQLKSHTEQASKFKAQEEMMKSLQGQVADLKVKLKLALENNHLRVSTQPETPLQTEGSLQTEESKQRQTSNQPGRSEERQTFNQSGRSEERQTSNQSGRSEERQTFNQSGRSEERQTSNQSVRYEERQTFNQRGVSHSVARPLHRPTPRLQPEESRQNQTSTQTWRSEERQTSMRPTSTGCMGGLHVGIGVKANLCPARPLRRPTPRWY